MKKTLLIVALLTLNSAFATSMQCQVKVTFETVKKIFLSSRTKVLTTKVENSCKDEDTIFRISENANSVENYCRSFHSDIAYNIQANVTQKSSDLVDVDLKLIIIRDKNQEVFEIESFSMNPNMPFSLDFDNTNIPFKEFSKRKKEIIQKIHFQCNQ